jgi:aspartyl/asparaginyl beta-hydroxylase (cupin superfamily)
MSLIKSSSSDEVPPKLEIGFDGGDSSDGETSPSVAPRYYDWRELFPQLQLLYDNVDVLAEEAATVHCWTPWPEDHFGEYGESDWTVFPFLHTFPALDDSKSSWISSTTKHCPRTTALLLQIPNIRTALFSRIGPGTRLTAHTGWADLANYVLRCHICINVPDEVSCGLDVDGEIQLHKQGEIIVFDDSKRHKAFNDSKDQERIVLIVDILRPVHIPLGTAKGGHTRELDDFVARFK